MRRRSRAQIGRGRDRLLLGYRLSMDRSRRSAEDCSSAGSCAAARDRAARTGFPGVNSQVSNSASRSCPEICSASAMNSSVVTLPPARVVAHCRQDREEVVVADREPQLVERHRPADVDREVEELVRARIADRHEPERVVGGDPVVQASKISWAVPRPSRSLHSHSAYVAKPSLSQMCCQAATARLSPYH